MTAVLSRSGPSALALVGLLASGAVAAPVPAPAPASATAAPTPRCFGAASRDPYAPCVNPALRLRVTPTPVGATGQTYAPCLQQVRRGLVNPCLFGTQRTHAVADIALVGDSHAGRWRAPLRIVAQRRRWRGISLTRSGCVFTAGTPDLPGAAGPACRRWNLDVLRWLQEHPEVHTLFVSGRAHAEVRERPRESPFAARVRGALAAWRRLPASVTRIVVLRDVPIRPPGTAACIERALREREPPGPACASARAAVLAPDPEAAAVRALAARGGRARLVDLSPFFCSAARCFPVIGGALVDKDHDHMTVAFATSLAPFLDHRLDLAVGVPSRTADDA